MKCKNCHELLAPLVAGVWEHFDGSYYCRGNMTHAEPEPEFEGTMSKPEPDPIKNSNPPVWELVIADMQERDKIGEERYGMRLQANNGRDALVDSYQEQLDHVVYMRQEIAERHDLWKVITEHFIEAGCIMPERNPTDQMVFFRDVVRALGSIKWLRQERNNLLRERNGEVWHWSTGQLEDGDNAETITCPIMIQPEDLDRIIKQQKLDYWLATQISEARDTLARQLEQFKSPIPMVLHCPRCGAQHIDKMEGLDEYYERVKNTAVGPGEGAPPRWENPPHKSHLCHVCKCIWRPAPIPTNGVEFLPEAGEHDTWFPPGFYNLKVVENKEGKA